MCSPSGGFLPEHTKVHADGSPTGGPPNPHHPTGLCRVERDRAASEGLERRRGSASAEPLRATRAFLTGDSALVRARRSLSCEDELPGQRPLREGRRHAGSPLLARRRAPVGLAPGLSRRWLRIPRASWPSRSSRPRTPGGIVSSCLGSRFALRSWAHVLAYPTGRLPFVAEGGTATS